MSIIVLGSFETHNPGEENVNVILWSGFEFSEEKGYYGVGESKEYYFPAGIKKSSFIEKIEEIKQKSMYVVVPGYPCTAESLSYSIGNSGETMSYYGFSFKGRFNEIKLPPAEKVSAGAEKIQYIDTIETTEKDKYTDGYVDGTYYYEYDGQR